MVVDSFFGHYMRESGNGFECNNRGLDWECVPCKIGHYSKIYYDKCLACPPGGCIGKSWTLVQIQPFKKYSKHVKPRISPGKVSRQNVYFNCTILP